MVFIMVLGISACGTPDAAQLNQQSSTAQQIPSPTTRVQPSSTPTIVPAPTTAQPKATPTILASVQSSISTATTHNSGRIIFMTGRQERAFAIYSMNADGSQEQLVVKPDNGLRIEMLTKFAVAPDGKQFVVPMDDGLLYRLNSDGSGLTPLINDIKNGRYFYSPAWSPDGKRIVFYRSGIMDSSQDGIYVVNADGSGLTRLTNDEHRDSDPAWSPDGKRIVFVSNRDGMYNIYTMNDDGSAVKRITTDQNGQETPIWSPDGTRIAFVRRPLQELRESDMYVVNVDGSGLKQLTDKAGREFHPTWSPDGSRIAYVHADNYDGRWDIYSMAPDGSDVTQLTDINYADAAPVWIP